MNNAIKIRLYKMTHDHGFAPNPYFGVLTLATCKPGIRRCAEIGEWIAGFSSKALSGTEVGEEQLVYLARVDSKLSFAEYYKAYPQKRPNHCYYGDNIYKPNENGVYEVQKNPFHYDDLDCKIIGSNGDDKDKDDEDLCHSQSDVNNHDLSSDNVLICAEFYYFGKEKALDIESNLRTKINIPKERAPFGNILENGSEFIEYVKKHKDKCKIIGEKITK